MQDGSDISNQPERQRWGTRGTAGALFAGKLTFENVSCTIGTTVILKDLSFELQAGEIACLLGQSGCGKTTLLRIAAGIQRPTAGRVLRPGGMFLFDTINRTWLASLVLVFLGEHIFRILPVGTHDPAKFIAPAKLASRLKACGFTVSDFTGWGPRGLNSKLDFVFGALPSMMIMYMGHATRDSD